MLRRPRADEAGGLYHALNRGNMRATIFQEDADYESFDGLISNATKSNNFLIQYDEQWFVLL